MRLHEPCRQFSWLAFRYDRHVLDLQCLVASLLVVTVENAGVCVTFLERVGRLTSLSVAGYNSDVRTVGSLNGLRIDILCL